MAVMDAACVALKIRVGVLSEVGSGCIPVRMAVTSLETTRSFAVMVGGTDGRWGDAVRCTFFAFCRGIGGSMMKNEE